MQRFERQVALVTGGAAGIGFAAARRLASEGARIVLLDWSEVDLEQAVRSLVAEGADCVGVRGSVAQEEDCDAAIAAALERWDRLDVLVANAGVRASGSLLEAGEAEWSQVLSVNLRGTANSCVAAAHAMRECRRRGAMVLVSSVHAEVGRGDMPIYDATKAAILSLTRSLAIDLASDGIRVNSVCPGFTVTEFHLRKAAATGQDITDLRATPAGLFRRPAKPEEIAAAIAFLASSDASYITATNLMVDGGVHAK
jgi:meso-butanediol dehydrogenase/(S,S)-butanediol dehydrogenase/diacetyl reductase